MTEIELEKQLGIEKLRVEINKMIEETSKIRAETAKIARERYWIPFTIFAGVLTASVTAGLTILPRLLGV